MEELRRLRKERGLTQRGLADASGVDPATISLVENGKRRPHLETLDSLAMALGVEVQDLIPKAQAPLPLDLEPDAGRPDIDQLAGELEEDVSGARRVFERRLTEKLGRAESVDERRDALEDFRLAYIGVLLPMAHINQALPGTMTPRAEQELSAMHDLLAGHPQGPVQQAEREAEADRFIAAARREGISFEELAQPELAP